jgi:hypothetical protein
MVSEELWGNRKKRRIKFGQRQKQHAYDESDKRNMEVSPWLERGMRDDC